jgi:hypothetical protein
LTAAAGSLICNANAAAELEIIVAADPDDDATLSVFTEAEHQSLPSQLRVWVAPERYGYTNLHVYLNELARLASGEWLMWFNDDMRLLTAGWDDEVREHRPAVLWPRANHVHHANIAPAWPKAWSDATGHASPVSHMDTYWQRVGEALGRHDPVNFKILHDRADVTGNHADQTYAEGREQLGAEGMVPGWDENAFHHQVAVDSEIIRGLL